MREGQKCGLWCVERRKEGIAEANGAGKQPSFRSLHRFTMTGNNLEPKADVWLCGNRGGVVWNRGGTKQNVEKARRNPSGFFGRLCGVA